MIYLGGEDRATHEFRLRIVAWAQGFSRRAVLGPGATKPGVTVNTGIVLHT